MIVFSIHSYSHHSFLCNILPSYMPRLNLLMSQCQLLLQGLTQQLQPTEALQLPLPQRLHLHWLLRPWPYLLRPKIRQLYPRLWIRRHRWLEGLLPLLILRPLFRLQCVLSSTNRSRHLLRFYFLLNLCTGKHIRIIVSTRKCELY